jgi:DNA-binding transcriptional regulator YdaS (Cro superfamily)
MARPPSFVHPLRAVAKIIGDSQSNMAARLKVSPETIKSICLGRMDLSRELSEKIRNATGAQIEPGRITATTPAKDRWGNDYSTESFKRSNDLVSDDGGELTLQLGESIRLLIKAAKSKKKKQEIAVAIAVALKSLAKKHKLGAELDRMLKDVPARSWSLAGRACDLRAALRLNVHPHSPHDCPAAKYARQLIAEDCRVSGADPTVDWNHPLTFDLRKEGGPANAEVWIYGKAKKGAAWMELVRGLPTISKKVSASYFTDVLIAIRHSRG